VGTKYLILFCEPRFRSAVSARLRQIQGRNIRICYHPGRITRARQLKKLVRDHKRAFVYVSAPREIVDQAMAVNLHFGYIADSRINGVEIWHARFCGYRQVWPHTSASTEQTTEVVAQPVLALV